MATVSRCALLRKDRSENAVFKCKKCRHALFTDSKVITVHGEPYGVCSTSSIKTCDDKNIEWLWYIKDENVMDWMEAQLIEGEWIKGKLFCPKCNTRLGSFDFVSGQKCPCGLNVLPSIHVVKGKVDCEPGTELQHLSEKIHAAQNVPSHLKASKVAVENLSLTQTQATESMNSLSINFQHELISSAVESSDLISLKSPKENSSLTINQKGLDSFSILSKDERGDSSDNLETKVKKQNPVHHNIYYKHKNKSSKKVKSEDKSKEISELPIINDNSVDSEEVIRSSLICPICLDLFLSPFTCRPCGHVFCELCLRKIAKSKPTCTNCPLCRQRIGICELNREVSHQVKNLFPAEHAVRLQAEDKNIVQCLPLPWTPNFHLRQFTLFGRNVFDGTEEGQRGNIWTSLSLSLPTIGILILLNIISVVMFLCGFFGCSFVPGILKHLKLLFQYIILWKVPIKEQTVDNNSDISVTFLIGVTVTLSYVIYRMFRPLVL